MKTKIFLFIALLLFTLNMQAQHKKFTFHSLIQAGLLEGEQGSALQLQTINGIKYKAWLAGIGIGVDYYHTRSIPLFLDVRKAFCGNEKTAFVYASGGYNFPWLTTTNKQNFITGATGGLYYDAGVGFELPVLKGQHLFFSAGYSAKYLTTTQQTWIYIDYVWPGPSTASDYKLQYHYSLQRISIKAGLRF
ncbi:MAG: hypothetical protein M3Y85_02960 [Bacteroidota bacterium]|nr:hypothetical protein [Bacteroidota bacterium]